MIMIAKEGFPDIPVSGDGSLDKVGEKSHIERHLEVVPFRFLIFPVNIR